MSNLSDLTARIGRNIAGSVYAITVQVFDATGSESISAPIDPLPGRKVDLRYVYSSLGRIMASAHTGAVIEATLPDSGDVLTIAAPGGAFDARPVSSPPTGPKGDAVGSISSRARGVQPATSRPDPEKNADAFQSWVYEHPEFSTVNLPNWEITLGKGIDIGPRNVQGQGNASRLKMSGLDGNTDALTVSGGGGSGGGAGQRAGRLGWFTLDLQDTGRDAIRWTGGIGCGAEDVTVMNVGRDGFHFEQSANYRYFERAFLKNCDQSIRAGRYGLCLHLSDFGASDTQFINKSVFKSSRLTGSEVADVALILNDSDGAGSDTKIGGGIVFDSFHGQYLGVGPARLGCGVLIQRGANSISQIDMLEFHGCTFEHNGGNPTQDRALLVQDESLVSSGAVIGEFTDTYSLKTGYSRWWDYNNEAAPVQHTWTVRSPRGGIYTNISPKEFGTSADLPGSTNIGASSFVNLFNATRSGAVWLVTVRSAFNANTYVTALVYGDSTTPKFSVIAGGSGNLGIEEDGGFIRATNSGGSGISVYSSAVPVGP